MIKIKALGFARRQDAEETVNKLKKGVDFQWLKSNAEGQLDPRLQKIGFDPDMPVMVTHLPLDVQRSVSKARSGEARFYAGPDQQFYALLIQEVIPERPEPFEAVQKKIAQTIYEEKLKKAVEEYAEKLKRLTPVKIYLNGRS